MSFKSRFGTATCMEKVFAPAKINLILRVFEKRPDGFHRIETVMQKLDWGDDVSVEVGEGEGISVAVKDHPELDGSENLAWRAAKLYLEASGVRKRLKIEIVKRTFIAAGLGGGSSDGAAVLIGLQKQLGALSLGSVRELAAKLGSDVPFFLSESPLAAGFGRGEEIVAWPTLPRRSVVLANPGFPVSTAEAYQSLRDHPLLWQPRAVPCGKNPRRIGRVLGTPLAFKMTSRAPSRRVTHESASLGFG